ncbi:MAG: transposase family protein [Ginsengibacter sp.]
MNEQIIRGGKLYISSKGLKFYLPEKTVGTIWQRNKGEIKHLNGCSFIQFENIPKPSLLKLPSKDILISKCRSIENDETIDLYENQMLKQKEKGFIKFKSLYKNSYNLSHEKALEAAQLHAVWQYIIRLTVDEQNRDTLRLFEAFNKVYPGKYKCYNSFANAKSEAIKKGAASVALDNRIFTAPNNVTRVSELQKYWTAGILSIGKKYSNRKVWELLTKLCEETKNKPPSKSWIDKYRKKLLRSNIDIFASRYGNEKSFASKQPFASMQHAKYALDQFQMDGFTLPFWIEGFKRFVIVIIRDAYSKKIIGSAVGESENTILIMAALRDAIINTGSLPFEILTDNHSFNQTKEAEYFKSEIDKIGTHFTVTSNPQHKSIIERYNKHLDSLCKDYSGYVGEGIRSRNVDARPKQEMLDDYAKPQNQLTKEAIQLIGIEIVDRFNSTVLPKQGKTPNQLFDESEKPHAFPVSLSDRIKILTAQTELKVNRGQINIKRGTTKYEYQLPANLYELYNDETVIVRYEDLNEGVYLYDKRTDESIIFLEQKTKIHGALANQTDEDLQLLYKNKGRLNGIKTQAKKRNEDLTREALEQNPEAYNLLNKITTPKDLLKEFEEKSHLKRIAEDRGISFDKVHIPTRESELDNTSLKPLQPKYKNPFTAYGHTIKKYNPLQDLEDDL